MSTLTYSGHLVVDECCVCGVRFAWPEDLREKKLTERQDPTRNGFFCPNGHSQHFSGKPEADLLRERLQVEKENAAFWRTESQRVARQAAAARGVTTKLKRRIANGVCPCCKRSFANVARHMASQHPEYPEAAEKAGAP